MRKRTRLIATAALAAQVLGPVSPASAVDPVTVTFSFTGAEQSWVVPAGVTSIHAILIGGRGGGVNAAGGFGHRAEADVTVTPGQTVYVEVGGPGSEGDLTTGGLGGFNGGGDGGAGGALGNGSGAGGGGATDLRTMSRHTPGTLATRLIVAGGGGGDGGGNGGAGGDAGDVGGNSLGGGAIGGAPGFDGDPSSGCGGCGGNSGGEDGAMGLGGRGGNDPTTGSGDSGVGGGGGGGGYQGGGGGGGGPSTGAGGGGGSSFADGWNYTNPNVAVDTSGTSSASITYVPGGGGEPVGGSSTGTVDVVVTMVDSTVCIELSGTSIDFGTRQFGEVGAPGTPTIAVTNCGAVSETILARGTDGTGAESSAWSLVDAGSCIDATLALDQYRLSLVNSSTFTTHPLSTQNATLATLDSGMSVTHQALIDTPCPGSSGAGVVMAMQIVFVATE